MSEIIAKILNLTLTPEMKQKVEIIQTFPKKTKIKTINFPTKNKLQNNQEKNNHG